MNQEYLRDDFSVKELKSRKFALRKDWLNFRRWWWPFSSKTFRIFTPEHLISCIYDAASGYGANLLRPFGWIALLTMIYWANIYLNGTVVIVYDKNEQVIPWVKDLLESGEPFMSLSYAVKAASGPLRFFTDSHLTVTSWSDRMWGDILSVVCTVLWFLGIVSIRRRFQIKTIE